MYRRLGNKRINDAMFGSAAASNARLSSLPGVYSRAYHIYNPACILSFSLTVSRINYFEILENPASMQVLIDLYKMNK